MQPPPTPTPPVRSLLTCPARRLTKGRKKRPVPPDWVTPEDIASLTNAGEQELEKVPKPTSLALDPDMAVAVVGGSSGESRGAVQTVWVAENKLLKEFEVDQPVTAVLPTDQEDIIVGTSMGSVRSYVNGQLVAQMDEHLGSAVTALCMHPVKRIIASVGEDKKFAFYDVAENKVLARLSTDSGTST